MSRAPTRSGDRGPDRGFEINLADLSAFELANEAKAFVPVLGIEKGAIILDRLGA